ncbi:MAG: SMC-Scp complex subunit ScpB, partial [Desulfatiglandales bacterium]
LVEVAGGFQFRTKEEFSVFIQRLYRSSPYRLSEAALETLAIIAYRQPISRGEIEELRGVDVSHILKVLLEKGLVRVAGRKEVPGRPLLYGTTKRFLEVFGLKDISHLPQIEELAPPSREIHSPKGEDGGKGH